jgi:hypothetical protein
MDSDVPPTDTSRGASSPGESTTTVRTYGISEPEVDQPEEPADDDLEQIEEFEEFQ